jgi:hypothetical protein
MYREWTQNDDANDEEEEDEEKPIYNMSFFCSESSSGIFKKISQKP